METRIQRVKNANILHDKIKLYAKLSSNTLELILGCAGIWFMVQTRFFRSF